MSIGSHRRCFGIHFGTEVAEEHERFGGAGVFESDSGLRGTFGGKEFIFREFVETEKLGTIETKLVGVSGSLRDDGGIGSVVGNSDLALWFDGEFLGGEILEVIDFAIDAMEKSGR